jgi:ABC-2 type transport system ATP-binding protein
MSVILTQQSLSKRYGDVVALDHVAIEIRQGEILGLIGPNGAGKTTLLECLSGLLGSDESEALLWNRQALPVEQRRTQMFYLPDGIRPYPDHFVVEILNFFKHTYSKSETDVEKIVQSLDLKSVLQKKIGTLSKGTLKRFLLALSLLTPHPLLILDEPFDGLDLRQAGAVMTLLRSIRETGRTLLLSIHQLTDAARICDRFLLLSAGRTVDCGTLDELKKKTKLSEGTLEDIFLALT